MIYNFKKLQFTIKGIIWYNFRTISKFQERHISARWCDNDGWSLNLTDCKESFLILLEFGMLEIIAQIIIKYQNAPQKFE